MSDRSAHDVSTPDPSIPSAPATSAAAPAGERDRLPAGQQVKLAIQFLLDGSLFPLGERLRVLNRLKGGTSIATLFRERLDRDAGGRFFRLKDSRFYFEPEYGVADEEALLSGVTQVLTESFVFPDLFEREIRVRPGDVVVDLGANIGTNTLIFSRHAGTSGHVYAFEPVVHELLAKNVKANGLANVTVVPKGAWSVPSEMTINIGDNTLVSRLDAGGVVADHVAARTSSKRTVELVTLDDFAQEQGLTRLDFVKMDIEGAEEDAIRGSAAVIKKFKPKWSISSYHQDFTGEPQFPKLKRLLEAQGYQTHAPAGTSRLYAF